MTISPKTNLVRKKLENKGIRERGETQERRPETTTYKRRYGHHIGGTGLCTLHFRLLNVNLVQRL